MRHVKSWLALSAVALFLFGVGAAGQDTKPADVGLSIRYLANEGFLLRGNERSVLIDAFVGEAYYEYAALPAEFLKQLESAKPPFDSIDLALTSHVHRDHFQAQVACAYLTADTHVAMWSTAQVIDAIRKHCTVLPGEPARLRSFWCEPTKTLVAEHAGLRVEFFPLFHVKDIQNIAHLIQFGESLVLHVGDAVLDEKEYAPYELAKRKIDLALLPYWYFLEKQACASVEKWIGAKRYVAMHVPPKDFSDVQKQIGANMPGVVLLEKCGDETRVELKK